jgi:NAD(P)H-dependent FMN reductase
MEEIIKILGLSGSLRKESYNRSALRAAVKLVPREAQLDTVELDNIPPFNQDHERDPPHAVRAQGCCQSCRRDSHCHPGIQLFSSRSAEECN